MNSEEHEMLERIVRVETKVDQHLMDFTKHEVRDEQRFAELGRKMDTLSSSIVENKVALVKIMAIAAGGLALLQVAVPVLMKFI